MSPMLAKTYGATQPPAVRRRRHVPRRAFPDSASNRRSCSGEKMSLGPSGRHPMTLIGID